METTIQRRRRAQTRRSTFDRNGFIGFRCPLHFKIRLEDMAKKKTRDVSSLAIEFVADGLAKLERQERANERQDAQ